MLGDLPNDFLRVGESSDPMQQQIAADAQTAQALQFQMSGGTSPFAARTMPRLSITVSQVTFLYLIISRRALAREGDYEMMPVRACVRVCVR